MWVLCANHEEYELGEGYSVNAFSESLTRLVEYALADAIRQDGTKLRIRDNADLEANDGEDVVLEYEYSKDSWGVWCVIEDGYCDTPPVDVDALTSGS